MIKDLLKFPLFCFWTSLFYIIAKLFLNLKIEGKENIPKNGPLLIVANHQNFGDGILITNLFPKLKKVAFIIDKRTFNNPLCRHLAYVSNAPIASNSAEESTSALLKLRSRIQVGGIVGIFPEGDVSSKHIPRNFKQGAAKLALDTKCSILPIFLSGTYDLRRWGMWFKKPTVLMRVGNVIDPFSFKDLTQEELTNLMRKKIIDLGNIHEIKIVESDTTLKQKESIKVLQGIP